MTERPAKAENATRTAIMDAAERMMAEHGMNGVSIRSILAEAGANTAALHYHFGSREQLVEAILARRGKQMNYRRREMLDALEARKQPPSVADIVDAVVDPLIEMLRDEGEAGRRYIRFLARLQSDRSTVHMELENRYFPDVHDRIFGMLPRACPHISRSELALRATMMLDTMLQSLANASVMAEEWRGADHSADLLKYARSLKAFLVGGLSAK